MRREAARIGSAGLVVAAGRRPVKGAPGERTMLGRHVRRRWMLMGPLCAVLGCETAPAPTGPPPAASAQVLTVPNTADPTALAELLTRARKPTLAPTGQEGATLVGKPTELEQDDEEGSAAGVSGPEDRPRVILGGLSRGNTLSARGMEQAARASLYFPLTDQCRDASGAILPPEAIELQFTVDAEGSIAPATIVATAKEPAHQPAAACMRRVLGTLPFRAPAAVRGETFVVTLLAPTRDVAPAP